MDQLTQADEGCAVRPPWSGSFFEEQSSLIDCLLNQVHSPSTKYASVMLSFVSRPLCSISGMCLLALLPSSSPRGNAATISFLAANVADSQAGRDLWEFTYEVEGYAFPAGQGFTIYFDWNLYAELQPALTTAFNVPDWSVLAVQSDSLLNADGFYDALTLRDSPATSGPFKLTAVWLGSGQPGPQPFEIYYPGFQPLVQGMTTPIPEPSHAGFLAVGLVVAFGRSRNRSNSISSPNPLRE